MVFDATFWVAISFIIFFGVLIYLKVPLKINESLNKLIADIKNELNESEKLRKETKAFLDQSQSKLNSASDETKVIIENAKKDADAMVQQMKDNFNKSAEIKSENEILKCLFTRFNFRNDFEIAIFKFFNIWVLRECKVHI